MKIFQNLIYMINISTFRPKLFIHLTMLSTYYTGGVLCILVSTQNELMV